MAQGLFSLDLEEIFVPTGSLLEIVLRGSLIYLALFVLLRVIMKRQSGGLAITDVLLIVLIADAAQNGMADDYKSVTEGVILVATLVAWSWAFDWLEFHVPQIQNLLRSPALPLIENGRALPRNLRQELVTMDDLMTALREHGIERIAEVRKAWMEPDGRISVIPFDDREVEANAGGKSSGNDGTG